MQLSPADLNFDQRHLWHPYTSMSNPLPSYPVVAADGVELILNDGRRLIDGMSSWWAAIHGYRVAALDQALATQAAQMSHVMFGGITHPAAIELGKRLVAITPEPLQRVFLADSGSIAVEVAIKMALQYWQGRGQPQRTRMMSLKRGYHGDTFAAMSVSDPDNGMHSMFTGTLAEQLHLPEPPLGFDAPLCPAWHAEVKALFASHAHTTAALMVEPIVQGAGGMRIYAPAYLRALSELCRQYEVLLIADEIATGFGRSGKLFACEHAEVIPDILCIGKALTGGYMTLAATLTSAEVAATISASPAGVFMHGPTFMGNPLACAVACASLDLLMQRPWQSEVAQLQRWLEQALRPCLAHADVSDVRVLGAIGVVELTRSVDVASIQRYFVAQGVWIRPFGRLIYLMPPYCTNEAQIKQLGQAINGALGAAAY